MFLMNYLIVHIQEIFIRFLLPHPQCSRIIVSMYINQWMVRLLRLHSGNCSSIMTLWKEVVVNKLSGEFCLTEVLLEKIEKVLEIWRSAHFKPLNWIKHGVEGFLTSCCFLETLCAAFFFFTFCRDLECLYTQRCTLLG